ncbi:hypothetical protein [Amycolatopsis jiangsuensis]|uniref:Uncharacterized protein n=1 Tax=Amycolatopsis jiangsuensis TaxID=1181879 RepID=A0A840J572_9PSEU|nr:hypothetical protein [Amycolatopsis jiangsuensis]MBB4688524.1 hypothetical protein [Amycolatopsis jiangsuensis]
MAASLTRTQWFTLLLLGLDAVLLALLEVFFLPLRVGSLGTVPLPLTALVGAVTTPWLVRTTAKLVRPGLSFVPLAVWVVVVFVIGLTGPGGDLVLVQDWRALLLLGASALPAALVLGGGLGRATAAKGLGRG